VLFISNYTLRTAFRPVLGLTQPPIQLVPGALSPRVMRPGRETDPSPPSSAEVKNGAIVPPLPDMSSWHSALLIKQRDKSVYYSLHTSTVKVTIR
jgi:hypothetical protein